MNAYETKQEARRERLEARAERLTALSDAEWAKGDLREEVSGIPFGQPILVGHHSERKHRKAIERAEAACRRSINLDKQAKETAARAAAVGTGGISSDDPDAIAKLKTKLAELEAQHEAKLEHNRAVQRSGGDWRKMYTMANSSAKIRATKQRIASLEKAATREHVEIEREGVRIVQNVEENRVQIIFPGKPDDATRAALKSRGFRWSPREGAWQRHLNNAGIHAAQCLVKELGQ